VGRRPCYLVPEVRVQGNAPQHTHIALIVEAVFDADLRPAFAKPPIGAPCLELRPLYGRGNSSRLFRCLPVKP
jgi:hypothetical protein